MADRLLTMAEQQGIFQQRCGYIDVQKAINGLIAQDAKTAPIVRKEVNEEWVAAIDEIINNCSAIGSGCDCEYYSKCDDIPMAKNCLRWQARKKEVGL